MTRYQIKLFDTDVTDLVHEIASQALARASQGAGDEAQSPDLATVYPAVFEACKNQLRRHTRGFHACGCMPHCNLGSRPAELARSAGPPPDLHGVDPRDSRIHRYVLDLEVPLGRFIRDLEADIVRAVASHMPVKNWHGLLYPVIRDVVESTMGKYLYQSSCCGQMYLCEVGVCTEFDPWERVQPASVHGQHPR